MRKKILITGSSGFIGHIFLKDALNKKYYVVDILRTKNKKNRKLLRLKKLFPKSYKSIFFSKKRDIEKKLKNKNFDLVVNFATLYKNSHLNSEIPEFIDSNITFPSIVLDTISSRVKKFINFGTMMQHLDGLSHTPKNFYASTKSSFEMILNYYAFKNKKMRFYNLKLYESFFENDHRQKLIPTLFKNFKNNKITTINSRNLELNIIHVNDIINAIYTIIKHNVESGTYCLKNHKNVKIKSLIKSINNNSQKKIKIKFLQNRLIKPQKNFLKILPKWKPNIRIREKIENIFLNENS